MTSFDETIMLKCIEIASKGLGWVSPNPLVGSILVQNGEIISEGSHEYFGGAHAEANCLLNLSDPSKAKGGTLYVNLEPCTHFGKTPPCTDIIKAYGVKKVIIGSLDPNPEVSGGGVKKLQDQEIKVQTGILKNECDFLNRRYFKKIKEKRPYIILKWAESADGFIAPEDRSRLQLSCEESMKLVLKWRGEESGIMVGSTTVLSDNPQLTNRSGVGRNPKRIVIDRRIRLTNDSLHIFNCDAQTIVYGHPDASKQHISFSSKSELNEILIHLGIQHSIDSILIEGGAELLNSFISENLWDEARIFTTQKILKKGISSPKISTTFKETIIGDDLLKIGFRSNA